MIVTTWALAAIVTLGTAWWLLRRRRAVILAVMTANYAVVIPLSGAASFWLLPNSQCSAVAGIMAALTWTTFVWLIVLLLVPFAKLFLADRLKQAFVEIPEHLIVLVISVWWIVKVWLFGSYGVESLMVIQATVDGQGPFSYVESTAGMLASSLSMGGIILTLLRLVWRKISWQVVVVAGITLVAAVLIGDVDVGVRRALVAMILFYLAARTYEIGLRRCWKEAVIAATIGTAMFVYYPFIRFNIYDPVVLSGLASGRVIQMFGALANVLQPKLDVLETGTTEVLREGVAQLQCRLNERQLSTARLSWGVVSGDAIYIALPAFLAPNKLDKDPDLRLAEEHDLYPDQAYLNLDLPANPLIQLQSDFGPLALPLAAGLQALALLLGSAFMTRKVAGLTRLVALSLLWMAITNTEASLTQVVVSMRDFVLLGSASEVLTRGFRLIWRFFGVCITRQPTLSK